MRGGGVEIASIVGVLLRENSRGCGDMIAHGGEHRVEENRCQYNILVANCEKRIGSYSPIEIN
jgi:hypothetical protein